MYQSCWYDYNEYKYYLRDDKNGWSSFNYQPTLYVKDPYGEFTALDGETVSPVKKPKDWKDPKYYEKDIEKVTRLLVDVYHDSDDLPSYHNLVYLDIECEIFGALTAENIKEAPSKITAIALHDGNNKTYFCFVLDEKNQLQEIKEGNKIVIPAKTEKELLELFLNKWEQLDPTIITGWNCLNKNESVWLNDRIISIKDIKKGDNLFNNCKVYFKSEVSKKEEYLIKLKNGKIIKSSKDHIFPYYFKEKDKYKNQNTIKINNSESKVSDILGLNKTNNIYLKQNIGNNINPDLNYSKLLKELNIDKPDYLNKEKINIELFRLLGLWFTNGSRSKTTNSCKFYNTEEFLIKDFIELVNPFKENKIVFENLKKSYTKDLKIKNQKGTYCINFSNYNNEISILEKLIYDDNGNKKLNKTLLSLLSYNQFLYFFSGLIDGDGEFNHKTLNYCNYDGNIDDINELLIWNGVYSRIESSRFKLSIPNLNFYNNKKFILNLPIKHSKKIEKKEKIKWIDKKNTIAKIKKEWFYEDYVLVEIKSIEKTNNKVEMLDISTTNNYFLTQGILTHNCGFFDIPYLFNRIKNQLGESQALRLSPIGKVREQPFDFEQPLKIGGVNHLDYLLLFKKYVTKQESSYKLNDIGKKYVDLSKVEYEGSLEKLFNEDKNKFIEYNLRDVEIIVALEEKLKYINLTTIICHLCHTEYEQIYYATAINEGRILTYLKRKGIISPNKPTTYNPELKNRTNEEKDYAGGFLLDPKIGLHHYLFDCDASSLYPTIMMSLNMSPETLIGRIVIEGKYDCWWSLQELKEKDQEEEITLESKEGKLKNIKIKELIEFIEENQLSISANGVLFRTDIKGVLPEVLEDGFTRRQELKKQMKDAGKKKDWNRYKLYEQRQHSFKILINSLYGAMSLPSFRFTDGKLFISSAITLTGQRLIQESIRFINSKIKEDIK